jgi:spore germination cell wall hydrolase CwlJ-like protein
MNFMKKAVVFVASVIVSTTLLTTTAFAADYRVVSNDSLYKIGVLFKTPVSTIMSDNSLKSSMIYPGQILSISAKVYTVKNGDTVYSIAKKYGITKTALRNANHISSKTNLIVPGQKLMIPGVKPSSSSATTSSSSVTGSTTAVDTKAVIPYTKGELDLLARLINAEAGAEPYNAQVAVGAVVVNRVQSSDWPNSISSVIYQKIGEYYQFTPVKNGMIDKAATDVSLKAAKEAIDGSDPSNGAMFYFDDSSTNQWIWSKPITVQIGHMVFAK